MSPTRSARVRLSLRSSWSPHQRPYPRPLNRWFARRKAVSSRRYSRICSGMPSRKDRKCRPFLQGLKIGPRATRLATGSGQAVSRTIGDARGHGVGGKARSAAAMAVVRTPATARDGIRATSAVPKTPAPGAQRARRASPRRRIATSRQPTARSPKSSAPGAAGEVGPDADGAVEDGVDLRRRRQWETRAGQKHLRQGKPGRPRVLKSITKPTRSCEPRTFPQAMKHLRNRRHPLRCSHPRPANPWPAHRPNRRRPAPQNPDQ
jgi:hypothetical protein